MPRIGTTRPPGGAGGVTDHGALTGLGDNDHPQYATNPGVDLYTAEPQALVLDRVYSYNDLSNNNNDWYATSAPGVLTITANTNRALPAGTVGDVVGTMSDNGNDGIYVVTSLGSGAAPWVLTRHEDYDTVETVYRNLAFAVEDGGTYFMQVDRTVTPSLDQGIAGIVPAHAQGGLSHAEGRISHAEGYGSHAEGGRTYAEGNESHSEGGLSHAEGNGSHAEGSSHAQGVYSHAQGYESRSHGVASHAEASGGFAGTGDAQMYRRVRKVETTNGTPTRCVPPFGSDVLQASKTVTFTVSLVASLVGGTEQKAWQFRGAMTNVGGTPALVGTVISESWGTPTWTAEVTANTDGPRVGVTGEAAATIRWVATIEQTEVGI